RYGGRRSCIRVRWLPCGQTAQSAPAGQAHDLRSAPKRSPHEPNEHRFGDELDAELVAHAIAHLASEGDVLVRCRTVVSHEAKRVFGGQTDVAGAVAAWEASMLDEPSSWNLYAFRVDLVPRHWCLPPCLQRLPCLSRHDGIDEERAAVATVGVVRVE